MSAVPGRGFPKEACKLDPSSIPLDLSMSSWNSSFLVSLWSLMSSSLSRPAGVKPVTPRDSRRLCQCLEVHPHFHKDRRSQPSTVL
ncbi:unnamed protein product, partial [Gulo gulo]